MLLAVLSGFVLAAFAPLVQRALGGRAGWVLALLPAALFAYFASFAPEIAAGGTVREATAWLPQLGVELSFYLDGLSLVFALLITGIGTMIVIYSGGYLDGHAHQGRFFSFILMFMASMLGLVVADDVIALFVFWELTSITSFLLIGFDHLRAASRRAAVQALVVTGIGGLSLLAGVILMGLVTDAWSLSRLIGLGEALTASPLYVAIFVLVLGAAFTKSAQVPFHFWLPNAMEAPTPVSAYLHSATMVKAGVYLLMRLNPALGDTALWSTTLTAFGAATLITGTVLSIRQTDLKLILAYTTVASLGLLVMLTGLGSEVAIEGAVLYLVAHSFFKGALFMLAGCVDHETGTRDITRLGGLRAAMPATFAFALLSALSMGGLPPFVGFLAKESIYAGTIGASSAWAVTAVAVIGNGLMFAAAFAVAWLPFAGDRVETPKKPHEAPLSLLTGPALLAVLGPVFGIATAITGHWIVTPMASAIAGEAMESHLSLWHGVNTPFLLSIATVLLGLGLLWRIAELRAGFARMLTAIGWGPDRGYDQVLAGLERLCAIVIGIVQPGILRRYLLVVYLIFGLALATPFILGSALVSQPGFALGLTEAHFHELGILVLAVIGAISLLFARTRLTAIVALGIQGSAVALIFLLFGAPDLSFTQFMVETLSVVILTLVMTRLRLDAVDIRSTNERIIDGGVALLVAGGVATMLTAVTERPLDMRLSDFFTEASVPLAHGHNIVNVILVDFRALDTLGEITVVMVTGLSVIALIRLRARRKSQAVDEAGEPRGDKVEAEA